jgi:hypothetical protein
MSKRCKERGFSGKCKISKDRIIYFEGKLPAVSELQLKYFIICSIKKIFNVSNIIHPEMHSATYDSSSFVARKVAKDGIFYYEDEEYTKFIKSDTILEEDDENGEMPF